MVQTRGFITYSSFVKQLYINKGPLEEAMQFKQLAFKSNNLVFLATFFLHSFNNMLNFIFMPFCFEKLA